MTMILVASVAIAGRAQASDFDGSKSLLCAPAEAYQCAPALDCQRATPEEIGVPRFVDIDFKKKTISGKNREGEERSTALQNVEKRDGKTILQGAENGRGWSIVVDQATGLMSASVADDGDGIVLFGACTAD